MPTSTWPTPVHPPIDTDDIVADLPADPATVEYLTHRLNIWWASLPIEHQMTVHHWSTQASMLRNGGIPLQSRQSWGG